MNKVKLVGVLSGLGKGVNEAKDGILNLKEGLDDSITKIVENLLKQIKEELVELAKGIATSQGDLSDKMDKIKDEIEKSNTEMVEKLHEEVEKRLRETKEQLEGIDLDLSHLAEFDLDSDGIVQVSEFFITGVAKLKSNLMKWNDFAKELLKLAQKDLGDEFTNRTTFIQWFTDKSVEYDFTIQKYLHLYNSVISNL